MKKIMKLSLVVLLTILMCFIGSVYAASSFKVELKQDKTDYQVNGDVVVEVNLTNMQVGNGINSFGAELQYDSNCFENVEVVGVNGWNVDYNDASKILIADSNKLMTEGGVILNIKFKVKSAGNIVIKNIQAAGGEGDIESADAVAEIKIGSGNTNPSSRPDGNNPSSRPDNNPASKPVDNNPTTNPDNGNNNQGTIPGANTNNGNEIKPDNTIKPTNIVETDNTNKVKIPQAGENDSIFYLIGGAAIVAVVFFVRIKMMK